MNRLLVILIGAYSASLLAAFIAGVTIVVPWAFLLLLVVAIPFSHAMTVFARLIEPARARSAALARCLSLALGVALVYVLRPRNVAFLVACSVFGMAFVWQMRRRSAGDGGTLLRAIATLWLGYASVWTLNYLIAFVTVGRLHDPTLRDMDLMVYRRLFGGTTQYAALFPLVRVPVVVELLENAYVLLFAELFSLVLTLSRDPGEVRRFFQTVFACYFLGVFGFVLFPVVGPCIAYPDSLDSAYGATVTADLMRQMATEYRAAIRGDAVNGFAYFVALPSLHVAVATVFQLFWARHLVAFWLFLPGNLLMILSTAILGYHYLVDVPAGVILAMGLYLASRSRRALSNLNSKGVGPG